MGVGTPDDLIEAVARGIDMFDCVMPTRNGRHGAAFTRFGPINLEQCAPPRRSAPARRGEPVRGRADYSRAYLHHLVRANEMLGAMLLSAINLAYYQELMAGMRAAIERGQFAEFRRADPRGLGQGRSAAGRKSLLGGKAPLRAQVVIGVVVDGAQVGVVMAEVAGPGRQCRCRRQRLPAPRTRKVRSPASWPPPRLNRTSYY